jgi:hypothetical protein
MVERGLVVTALAALRDDGVGELGSLSGGQTSLGQLAKAYVVGTAVSTDFSGRESLAGHEGWGAHGFRRAGWCRIHSYKGLSEIRQSVIIDC